MPSVRSRIKQFEALSGEDDKGSEEPNKANKRECFSYVSFLYRASFNFCI